MSVQFSTPSWEEYASEMPRNVGDTDKLMAAVCYRSEVENADTTDMSVVAKDYFRRARWTRPVNIAATANYCAGKGWLSEAGQADGHKLWRITRKGYDSFKSRIGKDN